MVVDYHRVVTSQCDLSNGAIRKNVRKKFGTFRIENSETEVCLCVQCKAYLGSTAGADNDETENTWPALVWCILRDNSMVLDVWKIIPVEWKSWWIDSVLRHHHGGITHGQLLNSESVFHDATDDCKKDAEALLNNTWRGLMEREESLVIPTVKCPAGCSEYKTKSNELPFDLVFQELLRKPLPKLLDTPSARSTSFTNIFRSDYLQHVTIANNPGWLCRPTLSKTKRGAPVVLCCRHHSVKSKHQMVHPPRNPTGSLSSTFSGGLSPVVPVPRTIQKAKISSHSASFHMAHLEGSFCGLDTMYLSSNSSMQSVNSTLGWKQDVLAYSYRSDVKAYTTKKYKNNAYEGSIGAALADHSRLVYPYLNEMTNLFLQGASAVGLNQAVQMQQHIDFSPPETGTRVDQTSGRTINVQFRGFYPRMLVYAHPVAGRRGSRPPQPPQFSKQVETTDNRTVWLLSSMMLLVPEVWQAISAMPFKKQKNWEGNLLTFLTVRCLDHITPLAPSQSPFPKTYGTKALLKDYFTDDHPHSLGSRIFRMGHFRDYFLSNLTRTPTIQMSNNRFPQQATDTANTVVITRDYSDIHTFDHLWVPVDTIEQAGKVWKLCYLAKTNSRMSDNPNDWDGKIYCRHSNRDLSQWWCVDRKGSFPTAAQPGDIIGSLNQWDVAVYVQYDTYVTQAMRDSVLASCGGQHKVYCTQHNYPLISVCRNDPVTCSCGSDGVGQFGQPKMEPTTRCGKKPLFRCAVASCTSSICRMHHASVVDWGGKYYTGVQCGYDTIEGQVHDIFHLDGEDNFTGGLNFLDSDQANDDAQAEERALAEDEVADAAPNEYGNDDDDERFEAHFRLQAAMDDDLFVTENRTGDDDEDMFTPEYDGEIQLDHENGLPTTDAGTLPIFTHVDQGSDYATHSISNHILLNNFGHMLIRRNKKLDGTSNQRNFLQRMASRTPGDTLPLAYPEGMLFSDMFNVGTDGGDIVGALPSALLNSDSTLHSLGFASLQDHYRTRLSNPAIFASSDPKYHLFAFDCLANLAMRGCDSRVILRRGFADKQGDAGVRFKDVTEERIFDTEHVDSSSVVNKLAAAVNERSPTYFYTHTCSMKTHFGMKLLWDWLAGKDVVDSYCEGHELESEREELRKNIMEGNGVLLLRSWMEMMHIWMNYITRSPEQPIGEVDQFLFRMELQDAKANLPHLHALLWTLDNLDTDEGRAKAVDRIRAFITGIMRPEEREKFKQWGVFEDDPAIIRFLSMVQTFLTHHHTRRCVYTTPTKRNSAGEEIFKCKAVDNRKQNPSPAEHTFKEIPVNHTQDAIDIMVALDLGRVDDKGKFIPSEKRLQALKHYPPAHGNEGIISPVFAGLLPLNPSMGNVQFASGYTLSRYLAKYIVAVDIYNTITIRPPKEKDEPNTFHVEGEELPNQKITGNRMNQQKREKKEKPSTKMPAKRQGRAFNVAEFYMLLFGYDPVMTNIQFVNISTKAYDERAGRDRMKPALRLVNQESLQNVALTPLNCLPSHIARRQKRLTAWRQFLDSQVQIAYDDLQSPVATSNVTTFSARPPELMFVARHQDYRRWFVEQPKTGSMEKLIEWCDTAICENIFESCWVNGFTSKVTVRAAAIPQVIDCLRERRCDWFLAYGAMLVLFETIWDANLAMPNPTSNQRSLLNRFVSDDESVRLPVVWFQSVRPTLNTKFLIHLLLSLGYMKDEYDLFASSDLRQCFVKAGLLDLGQPRLSALSLMKQYVIEQLATLPKGTPTFDRYLVAAYNTIVDLFVDNRLFTETLPQVLYCRLAHETEQTVKAYVQSRKRALVVNLLARLGECGFPNLPTVEQCVEASTENIVDWDIERIPRGIDQPINSYTEQAASLRLAKRLIHNYKSAPTHYTKGLCHVGAGGVGKTTVLFAELLYCICQGLNVAVTAINSERAQELAGLHIHDMFCLQGHEGLSAGQMAERAISRLYRSPEKFQFIRTLDGLGFDESGAIPCDIFTAMCHILRFVRDNNVPWGGILPFGTIDHLQLEPVSGRHPLMNPAFTACFYFRELVHSVRAATDPDFMRIQEITRLDTVTLSKPETRSEFISLFEHTFSFVTDLDDPSMPRNILYTFGQKRPIRKQEKRLVNVVLASHALTRTSHAIDEEKNVHGTNYRPASASTSRILDRDVKEPKTLVLIQGGRYQLTYNNGAKFSNAQLAVLFDLPTQEHVDKKLALKMVVAPAGCKIVPDDTVTRDQLLGMGWKEESVGTPARYNVVNAAGSTRGKRRQYGMRSHVGSTIHGVMGQTLLSLITRVERGDKTHPYSLWLASQVVVLLSRTKQGRQTFFWMANGQTPNDVAHTLYDLLCKTSPFRDYLSHLLQQLCNDPDLANQGNFTIDYSRSIYRPKDMIMPTHQLGYVYMLVSTKMPSCVYIGSTKCLIKRWRQHNSGYGSKQTQSIKFRPWAILAFIIGFDGDSASYLHVEDRWLALKEDHMRAPGVIKSVETIQHIGKDVVETYNRNNPNKKLTFVSCGTVERVRNEREIM